MFTSRLAFFVWVLIAVSVASFWALTHAWPVPGEAIALELCRKIPELKESTPDDPLRPSVSWTDGSRRIVGARTPVEIEVYGISDATARQRITTSLDRLRSDHGLDQIFLVFRLRQKIAEGEYSSTIVESRWVK